MAGCCVAPTTTVMLGILGALLQYISDLNFVLIGEGFRVSVSGTERCHPGCNPGSRGPCGSALLTKFVSSRSDECKHE